MCGEALDGGDEAALRECAEMFLEREPQVQRLR